MLFRSPESTGKALRRLDTNVRQIPSRNLDAQPTGITNHALKVSRKQDSFLLNHADRFKQPVAVGQTAVISREAAFIGPEQTKHVQDQPS